MNEPKISIIAALSKNRVIGKNNSLPWNISEDMKHFRELTAHHAVIMGRKTFESIGRSLPNRTNFVITRDPDFKADGVVVCYSLDEAFDEAKKVEKQEIFVIGGGQIYSEAIQDANKLYLTIIEKEIEGDTFFPDYSEFTKIVSESSGESGDYQYKFLELER